MWIENSFRDKSFNLASYHKASIALTGPIVYLIAEGVESIGVEVIGIEAIALYSASDNEQARGVYEWIMQCLEKERPVCRISDAPVLRGMLVGSVTEWRMK